MIENLKFLETQGWIIRYHLPNGDGPHPVIWMFHGWTGDEDSMWIFGSRLPEHYLLLAPRGLYPTSSGGFSWHPDNHDKYWPQVDDFILSINKLFFLMDNWPATAPLADFSRFRVAGFSQGGAMAYSLAILHPERILALAGLASFLPEHASTFRQHTELRDIPIFISHGTKDHLVPVTRARQAVQYFDQAGAQVSYCESDFGHKLSADCFKGMEVFFKN